MWIAELAVVDILTAWHNDTMSRTDLLDDMTEQHSYHYATKDGLLRASRLDRFYVSTSKSSRLMKPNTTRRVKPRTAIWSQRPSVQREQLSAGRSLLWQASHYVLDPQLSLNIIDVWDSLKQVLRRASERSKATSEAVALLLDFSKAYDTLKRDHMMAALCQAGLSAKFCSIVEAKHRDTTAIFLVNGFQSSAMALSTHDSIQGLRQRQASTVHTVEGFADDTTLFQANKASVQTSLRILEHFGHQSRLKVNLAKSVLIPLGRKADDYSDLQLQVLGANEYTRYLGIQVGVTPTTKHTWQVTVRQIQARLTLAQRTTNNAL
ncbi:TPA: hypothetical protein N0F65_000886 [Lagenidium giganteum]|uniref:Reverse transcriptase domain-containing protein n=1 Tax=Lagenidium giganteum TaxID=4803 RepID=A0AAV2Z0X2_9STRA|nr:TPA: hypothetical protein N0F65_000886 [Lagenidium giganteum]